MTEKENENRKRLIPPWLHALIVILLYAGLLVLLWFFPLEIVRDFFRTLLGGMLYVFAGAALILVTLLFIILLPWPPSSGVWDEEDGERDALDVFREEIPRIYIPSSRVLIVPALKEESEDFERALTMLGTILAMESEEVSFAIDDHIGALSLIVDEYDELPELVRKVREKLQSAGLKVRNPR